jgi:hypothetical protein
MRIKSVSDDSPPWLKPYYFLTRKQTNFYEKKDSINYYGIYFLY